MPRTSTSVSNSDDVIDSRDIIARISELEELRDDLLTAATENCLACGAEIEGKAQYQQSATKQPFCSQACAGADEDNYKGDLAELTTMPDGEDVYTSIDFGEDKYQELKVLKSLEGEADGCADWRHGETLIRDSYFVRYAEQLAEDCGMLKDSNSWPGRCIDWEKAAEELQRDYTSVDFDGVDYWIRS